MNIEQAQSIINGYADWWRAGVKTYQVGDAVRLVCPMLDRNNDHMSLYIAEDPQQTGSFLLSDLGATIADLEMSGCDIFGSKSRASKLEQTLNAFGVMSSDGEIYARANSSDLFPQMNMLMQAMASVDDLFYTAKDSVRSYFIEDVAHWLDGNEIRYSENLMVRGTSGFESKFDFLIPKTKGKAPERLLKAIGSPSEASVKNALFGWNDIQRVRSGAQLYVFLNDDGKETAAALRQACEAYNATPVPWSNADQYIPALAA
ncbi:DUF1829 domain-containing protein [uncultured Adlercreutzia sp.]|uniref:DUF1829 domain-containing protein n=1 Tax=uncultured Adlercreutzia sp. TaxID=875803 RepID=UPI0025F9375A|nr:DUF1829 domain-containing protein [uncultured Adlercreutzia sp.]